MTDMGKVAIDHPDLGPALLANIPQGRFLGIVCIYAVNLTNITERND